MNQEIVRDKPLFEATLDVCIQAGSHTDAKTTPLVFRVLEGVRQQQSSSQSEKIFHFELTDTSDPFFLFILDIGEYDFHNLKREQSILVDFLAFPGKLIALMKTCIHCSADQQSCSASSFATTLDANSGLFSIVESNEFKNLTHLSLQLRPANDAALKSYLCARLQMSLQEANGLRKELELANQLHSDSSQTVSDLNHVIAEMKSRLDHEVITLQASHSNELSSLKIAHTDAMNMQKAESEAALTALRVQSDAKITELRRTLEEIKEEYAASEKTRSSAEYRVRELERELVIVSTERDRADSSSQQYAKSLSDRDAVILGLERDVAGLQSKIESYKQQLKDKEEIIAHATGEKVAAEAARAEACERIELFSSAVEAMQEKLYAATNEMNRGNQMIKSQLKEIDDLREKIRIKNEVIRKQEAVVNDGRAQVADLMARLQNEVKAKETEQQRVEILTREAEAGREKIAAGIETIERNKEIMNHLNEMITALQMGSAAGGVSPSWTSPQSGSMRMDKSNVHNKSYGFPVVSGKSPDGPGGLYDALSPPFDPDNIRRSVNNEKSSSEEFKMWTSNRAMTDTFSTRKYDSLVTSYPADVTPASTSASRNGVEADGYYRGLPVGSSSLTPSVSGDAHIFLRSGGIQRGSAVSADKGTGVADRKYHWQADDFGVDDDTSVPAN